MTNLNEIQQRIHRELSESPNPLGPTEIADKLGLSKETEKSKIHYNLNALKKKGLVTYHEKGKYSVNKDEMEIIKGLENEILNLLTVKEYNPRELEEELNQDEGRIIYAIGQLEINGLIKEGKKSLAKRSGIPRKGPTFLVSDYYRTSTYTPTYLGYSEIGFCPICKEKFNEHESILTTFFKPIDQINERPWASTNIHSKCLANTKAYEETYRKNKPSMFCSYCGLPLTPKLLPEKIINYKLLKNHFFSFELKSIKLLENLRQSWLVPMYNPFEKEQYATRNENSTIKQVYGELGIEVPSWLDERLNEDKKNPEINQFDEISYEISRDVYFIFKSDLSSLENVENFMRLLIKHQFSYPEEYNINSRIRDIWTAAQEIRNTHDENIRKTYEKLLGPEANLYPYFDWAFDYSDYDFDKVRRHLPYSADNPPIFAQTFTVKCGNRYYHPYCADKLGINDNHCNDNNSKGGEGVE
ncbi:ArsR family transcriptional regulator [Methanolobus sp. ZRKC3]|uniref:hypothetical protein n=1 Tax=Methanolobus sp. ZRKC3 TaxID=3125786 RepID=UPI003255E3B2